MQFTLHASRRTPHGASRLVKAMSAWLVTTRRAPSWHSRDAEVNGHTTAAMHKLSTPPPLPAPVPLKPCILSKPISPGLPWWPFPLSPLPPSFATARTSRNDETYLTPPPPLVFFPSPLPPLNPSPLSCSPIAPRLTLKPASPHLYIVIFLSSQFRWLYPSPSSFPSPLSR